MRELVRGGGRPRSGHCCLEAGGRPCPSGPRELPSRRTLTTDYGAEPVATSAPETDPEREAATKAQVLAAAERLFALHGFQNVSVRDITAEAGVNLAWSTTISAPRTPCCSRSSAGGRPSSTATGRGCCTRRPTGTRGKPPVREILRALFEPPLRWSGRTASRRSGAVHHPRPQRGHRGDARGAAHGRLAPAPLRRRADGPPARSCRPRTSTGACTSAWG